jgi:formate-dependent phosphoribosylglycinamide formyltransferase (GAR transformylase)
MHILLVETTSVRGFDIVEEMADAGIEVSFLARNLAQALAPHDPAQVARAARLVEAPELGRDIDLATLLEGRLGPNRLDGVICREEACLRDVARLTTALGLPGESEETARRLVDKAAVRERVAQAGLGALRWRAVRSPEEARGAAAEIGYPLVVKPTTQTGWSIGVSVVHDAHGLDAALSAAMRSAGAVVLLEEFVPGRLVSAEILVQDGEPLLLGFGERVPCPPGVTAELGGHFPARFEGVEAAESFARDVVRALGVRNSPIHMEMMITARGPELVEVNGRIAGYVVMQQMSHALGRSIAMDLVAVATGRPLAPPGPPVAAVAIRPLWSDRAGTVTAVRRDVRLHPDVILHGLSVAAGSRVAPLRTNSDRFGFVLARGGDAQTASDIAAQAAATLLESVEIAWDDAAEILPFPADARLEET